jgi:recombination protein RecT
MAVPGNNLPQLKQTLNAPSVKAKFEEMLGRRAPQFLTSITTVVQNNALLQKADVNSIVMGAAVAASMDLPLHPSLGYAALVPFNTKEGCFAQLQVMVKGLTELALRSGQIHALIAETVYEGQLVKKNKFTGDYVFDEDAKKSDKIIGFMAYIRLANGFEKYEYMTVEEIKAHAMRFSQTFKKGFGVWKEHFEEMAKKTVLRRILTRWAPKSLEMQQGLVYDQSVVKGDIDNVANATAEYFDGGGSTHVVEEAEVVEVDEATGEVVDTAKAEQF